MTLWVGDASGVPRQVTDPSTGDASRAVRPILEVWVGDPGGRPRLVFQRAPEQTVATLGRAEWGTYDGSGNRRIDANGVTYGYSGYASATYGNQKCLFRYSIPADLPDCLSVDKVEVSAYNMQSLSSPRKVQLALHHHTDLTSTSASSTETFAEADAASFGWVGGAEWIDVTDEVTPGRNHTVAEEFRTYGAQGVVMNTGPTDSTSYYGYVRNDVRIRLTYTAYARDHNWIRPAGQPAQP